MNLYFKIRAIEYIVGGIIFIFAMIYIFYSVWKNDNEK